MPAARSSPRAATRVARTWRSERGRRSDVASRLRAPLMLARAARLTTGREFSETIRRGRRSGARSLVVHLQERSPVAGGPPRAGFVVARSVGPAVTRNRVKRRLRHLVREHLAELPAASRLVVRALPAAAAASSRELDRDLRRALQRARGGSPGRSGGESA